MRKTKSNWPRLMGRRAPRLPRPVHHPPRVPRAAPVGPRARYLATAPRRRRAREHAAAPAQHRVGGRRHGRGRQVQVQERRNQFQKPIGTNRNQLKTKCPWFFLGSLACLSTRAVESIDFYSIEINRNQLEPSAGGYSWFRWLALLYAPWGVRADKLQKEATDRAI